MKNNELQIGEVRSMYFDETALNLPPVPLYRIDVKGHRQYFSMNDDGQPVFYDGVTTITGTTLPKSEYLVKWIADMGYENAKEYRDTRAAYGTLLHTIIAHLLINTTLPLETVPGLVDAYINREGLYGINARQWVEDIQQDVLSFAQFIKDYDVKPLAVEISLCDPLDGIAGTVDMPCLMTLPVKCQWGEVYASGANKGQPKETVKHLRYVAIVDFKSGRKSYAGDEGAAAQLRFYKYLVNKNFPELQRWHSLHCDNNALTVKLFNWSPKDWQTVPGYHLADQTEAFTDQQAALLLEFYRTRTKPTEESKKAFFSGMVKLGNDPAENFTLKTIPQLAAERFTDKEMGDVEMWHYLTVAELFLAAETDGQ
jgi:hypothetical protein